MSYTYPSLDEFEKTLEGISNQDFMGFVRWLRESRLPLHLEYQRKKEIIENQSSQLEEALKVCWEKQYTRNTSHLKGFVEALEILVEKDLIPTPSLWRCFKGIAQNVPARYFLAPLYKALNTGEYQKIGSQVDVYLELMGEYYVQQESGILYHLVLNNAFESIEFMLPKIPSMSQRTIALTEGVGRPGLLELLGQTVDLTAVFQTLIKNGRWEYADQVGFYMTEHAPKELKALMVLLPPDFKVTHLEKTSIAFEKMCLDETLTPSPQSPKKAHL